jgi:CheY-like chemotaxis protein
MEPRLTPVSARRIRTTGRATPQTAVLVLLVEGRDGYRTSVSRVLRRAGYEIEATANGFEALVVASTVPVDVLVTDLELPRMRGQELARRLRARHPALRVVFFNGQTPRLYSNYELTRDDEVFLDKPSTAQGVLDALSAVVSGKPTAEPVPA